MSSVPAAVNRRPRAPAEAGTRRAARLDLGSPEPVPALQEDIHGLAHLVGPVWPLQLLLPAAGVGVARRAWRLGTIGSPLQRSHSIAGCVDASPVGLPQADQSLVLDKDRTRGHGILNFIQWTYHPCLGLRSRRPYSAPGGKFAMKCQMAETLKPVSYTHLHY